MESEALEAGFESAIESSISLVSGAGESRLFKFLDTLESFRFSLWNYRAFPREHWRRIWTINGLERISK